MPVVRGHSVSRFLMQLPFRLDKTQQDGTASVTMLAGTMFREESGRESELSTSPIECFLDHRTIFF